MVPPAPPSGPALLPGADGLLLSRVLGGRHHLAVVSCEARLAPTLVDSPAVAAVEAGDDALAELAVCPVVAGSAVTGVPLDTLPSVLTGSRADPALAPGSLEPRRTLAQPGGRAVASVQTLRVAHRLRAMTTSPALCADTPPGPITVAVIVTDPVTAGVLAHLHTLLPQPQLERGPG